MIQRLSGTTPTGFHTIPSPKARLTDNGNLYLAVFRGTSSRSRDGVGFQADRRSTTNRRSENSTITPSSVPCLGHDPQTYDPVSRQDCVQSRPSSADGKSASYTESGGPPGCYHFRLATVSRLASRFIVPNFEPSFWLSPAWIFSSFQNKIRRSLRMVVFLHHAVSEATRAVVAVTSAYFHLGRGRSNAVRGPVGLHASPWHTTSTRSPEGDKLPWHTSGNAEYPSPCCH